MQIGKSPRKVYTSEQEENKDPSDSLIVDRGLDIIAEIFGEGSGSLGDGEGVEEDEQLSIHIWTVEGQFICLTSCQISLTGCSCNVSMEDPNNILYDS